MNKNTAKKINKKIMINGINVTAEIWEYGFDDDNPHLYNEELEMKNDIIIFDAYKKKIGLLTSEEIISFRKKYNISQQTLSKLLGLGAKTITRYENGSIQDKSNDILLRLLMDNINNIKTVYNINKDNLSKKEQEKFSNIFKLLKVNDFDNYFNNSIDKIITFKVEKDSLENNNEDFIYTIYEHGCDIYKSNNKKGSVSNECSFIS